MSAAKTWSSGIPLAEHRHLRVVETVDERDESERIGLALQLVNLGDRDRVEPLDELDVLRGVHLGEVRDECGELVEGDRAREVLDGRLRARPRASSPRDRRHRGDGSRVRRCAWS